ncbi:LytR/AlgR family response regulator transcription factor [Fusicatenibacter sp.]
MHLILCDDDNVFLDKLETRIRGLCQKHGIAVEMERYDSSKKMLEGLKDLDTVPVFLIDIDMPEVNGFAVASFLKKWNRECCIGFVSNKDELVFQAFAYHPFFFIRKTHLDEELEPQLLEMQKKMGVKVPKIELQTGRQTVEVALDTIWFVESEKNYLLFYREKDERGDAVRARMKIAEAEKELEPHGFVRTHKGYLVNMNYVYRLRENEILLLNGKHVPVSRSYLNQVRMKIMGAVMG